MNSQTFVLERADESKVTIIRQHYPEAAWEKFLPIFRTRHHHARRAARAAGLGVYPAGQLPAAA